MVSVPAWPLRRVHRILSKKYKRRAHESVLCMKMWPLKYSTTVICAVFIAIGAASGEEVKNEYGALGHTVSFGPTNINLPVSSIIWKHKDSSGVVVKAIEWDSDDDSVTILNQRYKDITTIDKDSGNITIRNLNDKHSGLYTIDINSKEQEQKFKLEIMPPVPKPEIKIEKTEINPNVVYLICEYNEMIIWKNSAGDILKGSSHSPKGELINVEKTGNPDVFYTCTLENKAIKKTSDPVYERDLFKKIVPWWIFVIVIILILILLAAIFVLLYKVWPKFHDFVSNSFSEKTCIGGILNCLDGGKKSPGMKGEDNPQKFSINAENVEGIHGNAETDPLKSPIDAENVEGNDYVNAETGGDKREGAENSNEPPKADRDDGDKEDKL